jgi:glycosyltransferase involved in cell wall biosynthesis
MPVCKNFSASVQKLEGGLKSKGEKKKISATLRPLVSVITVCLNSEKYLEQTIRSVLNQTYDNIEYIIVDGGSKDSTIRIIQKYEKNISYWSSEPDKGIFDAMNKGIAMSKGQLVGLLNSDDWYNRMTIEWVVKEFLSNPDTDVFYGDIIRVKNETIYKRSAPQGKNVLENLKICIFHPTIFVRSGIYREYKYDSRYRVSADRDFIMRLYFHGKKFTYINRPITYFRTTGISNQPSFRSVLDRYIIRSRYDRSKGLLLFIKDIVLFFDELVFSYKNQRKKQKLT